MPEDKKLVVRYNSTLDQTYIESPGKGTQVFRGDVRGIPGLLHPDELAATEPTGMRLKANPGAALYSKNLGKDLLTDLASSLATAFIPGGPILRGLGSAAVGTGVDQMVNPDKPFMQSAGEGTLNAALGEILPMLAFEHPQINIPGFSRNKTSVIRQDPTRMVKAATTDVIGNSKTRGVHSGVSSSEAENVVHGSSNATSYSDKSGTGVRDSTRITRNFEDSLPEHSGMQPIRDEIARLEAIDTSSYNKEAAAQVDKAIQRNKEALSSLEEANYDSGIISKLHEDTSMTGKGKTSSSGTNSREGKGNTSGRTAGTAENDTQKTGTSKNTGNATVYHGNKIMDSNESGSSTGIRGLIEMIRGTRLDKGQPLDPLSKFLAALGFNIGADVTVNNRNR